MLKKIATNILICLIMIFLMGVVFFLVIMPVGIVIRLIGRDPLYRKLESSTDSYRVDPQISENDSLEKPY